MPEALRGSSTELGLDFWGVREQISSRRRVDQPFRDAFENCVGLALAFGFVQGCVLCLELLVRKQRRKRTNSAVQGYRFRGIQFLAENAHRTPHTKAGWYLYHKTKNYQMLAAGIKRGASRAIVFASLPCLVIGTSELVARLYLNSPYEIWSRLLRPRPAQDCPPFARILGSSIGGYALGILGHRYYRLPKWHRRLIYTRATLAGAFLGLVLEAYYWLDWHVIEPSRNGISSPSTGPVPAMRTVETPLDRSDKARLV